MGKVEMGTERGPQGGGELKTAVRGANARHTEMRDPMLQNFVLAIKSVCNIIFPERFLFQHGFLKNLQNFIPCFATSEILFSR